MDQQMLQAVNNVLTILGPNLPSIIVTHGYDQTKWEWRVADKRERNTMVAFTGSLFGCLTVQAEYNKPNPDADLF